MLGVPITNRPGDWAEGVIIVDPSTGQPFSSSNSATALVGTDAGGRQRISQLTTLFDGKVLNSEDTLLWDTKGTGTATWANSGVNLAVTPGQYLIRQSKYACPYSSGKSQVVETTFDSFINQEGVAKRVGYFNSNAIAPYASNYDGVWIEATGTSYKLCVANDGALKLDLDWTLWDNYSAISDFDWDSFNVTLIDFLWLGGAVLRLFLKTSAGFILAHTFSYASSGVKGPFMKTPQHGIRYEIRSTSGSGNFNSICSQVASEGSVSEVGYSRSIFHPTGVTANAIGTIYPIKGARALTSRRDLRILVNGYSGSIASATSDAGTLMLLLNPTLSAPLTWVAGGLFDEGTASSGQTITAVGTVIDSVQLVSSASSAITPRNMLSTLSVGIDNTLGNIVLAYMPLTANQVISGSMSLLV